MKKQLVCSFIAATLMAVTFATEPAANFVLSEFKGSADFGVKFDIADSNNLKIGMYNIPDASLKFGFVKGGYKTTKETDGIWGELKISTDSCDINNGKINIGKVEEPKDSYDINNNIKIDSDTGDVFFIIPGLFPLPKIEIAKINFTKNNFYSSLDILKPSMLYENKILYAALPNLNIIKPLPSDSFERKLNKIGNEKGLEKGAGFGLNIGVKDLFDTNIKLIDNGVTTSNQKRIGLATDITINKFKNLTAKIMSSFNFSENYKSLAAELAYKIYFNDVLYIQPGAFYTLTNSTNIKEKQNLTTGIKLGWGKDEVKPNMKYIAEKTSEGLSISASYNFVDPKLTVEEIAKISFAKSPITEYFNRANCITISSNLYDESLFSFLNIDKYGKLQTAISYLSNFYSVSLPNYKGGELVDYSQSIINSYIIAAGLKYTLSLTNVYVNLGYDLAIALTDHYMKPEQTPDMDDFFKNVIYFDRDIHDTTNNWLLKVGTNSLIDNTDLYLLYEGEYKNNKMTKHELSIGTKISF